VNRALRLGGPGGTLPWRYRGATVALPVHTPSELFSRSVGVLAADLWKWSKERDVRIWGLSLAQSTGIDPVRRHSGRVPGLS
jgi:hypothetical protein